LKNNIAKNQPVGQAPESVRWKWDFPGGKVWWSDGMYRIFGVKKGCFLAIPGKAYGIGASG